MNNNMLRYANDYIVFQKQAALGGKAWIPPQGNKPGPLSEEITRAFTELPGKIKGGLYKDYRNINHNLAENIKRSRNGQIRDRHKGPGLAESGLYRDQGRRSRWQAMQE